MKSRADKIKEGRIYQVYYDSTPDHILFEGNKTNCLKFIKETFGMKMYKNGSVRMGQLVWENIDKENV